MKAFTPQGYWDARYRQGRDSGAGSRGEIGEAKAAFVNEVIDHHGVASLIDWGCGDGQVLAHLSEGVDYLGVDVSPVILDRVRRRFPGRRFAHVADVDDTAAGTALPIADMAISMDVLFHFPDDADYHAYLDRLFASANRLVLIYATDDDRGRTARHVRRRRFTPDVAARYPDWHLSGQDDRVPDDASFFLYEREV